MTHITVIRIGVVNYSLVAFSNRSAKEAEDNIRKALEKGQVLPKEERFDSNCITPGMHLCALIHYVQNV